jgi:hypothetical protein
MTYLLFFSSVQNLASMPKNQNLIILFSAITACGLITDALAWGHDGHSTVGILSLENLQSDARTELQQILGNLDDETIIEACNWPDKVRPTPEWEWTYPLHFINFPKDVSRYSGVRDCPEKVCVTEAIKKYAAQLGDERASQVERQQAFAFICHFTGDLHQPLHVGYSGKDYDMGANEVDISFDGEAINLHDFWDRALIEERAGSWQQLLKVVGQYPKVQAADNWSPAMVDDWTDESRQLVNDEMYPENPQLSQSYQDKSWALMQQRILTASSRLALIINTVL